VVGGPLDQARAQVGLELGEQPGHRRLGHVHPGRRGGDRAGVGDVQEGPQVPQVGGHACRV
jgi:hypothetical protein